LSSGSKALDYESVPSQNLINDNAQIFPLAGMNRL